MKFKSLLAVFILVGAVAVAGYVKWPHSKKYPVDIVTVYSPTEFKVYFKEQKKSYRLRLAFVAPLKKKDTKEDKHIKDNYNQTLDLVKKASKRNKGNNFVEFEGDDIQFDGDSETDIVGYLFLDPKTEGSVPINCGLMQKNTELPNRKNFSAYQQENDKDSKGKQYFETYSRMTYQGI